MFFRNTAVLAGGNILAQLISIALIPVVTRIYSTEQFGEFSIIAAIAMLLVPVSSLRYNAAILLPEKECDSKALLYLSIFVNFIIVSLLLLTIYLFNTEISELTGIRDAEFLYFVPLIVFLGGWQLLIEAWALRNKAFVVISIGSVGATSSDRLTGILSGIIGVGTIGLLFGRVTGLLINLVLILLGLFKQRVWKKALKTSIRDVYRQSVVYKNFAIYSWAAMIQQMARQAPIFLLGIFYSSITAGLYALCFRVLAEPVQILGAALGRSFAQRAAEDKRSNKELSAITYRLFKYLLMLIVVPMIVLAVSAPDIFVIVFGEQWKESGHYVQLVAPVFIFTFLLRSLGVLFDVMRKQKDQLVFGVTMLAASVCSFSLGFFDYSVDTVLIVYSISMSLVIGSRIVWILRMVNVELELIIRSVVYILINAVIFSLPVYYSTQVFFENALMVLLFSVTTVVIYFVQCVYRDKYLKNIALNLLR